MWKKLTTTFGFHREQAAHIHMYICTYNHMQLRTHTHTHTHAIYISDHIVSTQTILQHHFFVKVKYLLECVWVCVCVCVDLDLSLPQACKIHIHIRVCIYVCMYKIKNMKWNQTVVCYQTKYSFTGISVSMKQKSFHIKKFNLVKARISKWFFSIAFFFWKFSNFYKYNEIMVSLLS